MEQANCIGDRSCYVVSFGDDCVRPEATCSLQRIKTTLKPLKITTSTAKIKFLIPRQSVLDRPEDSGWSFKVFRAGSHKQVAEYPIESYDRATGEATFFIDDTVRMGPKGYYIGELHKDCCITKMYFHLDCEKAVSYTTVDFKYDPCAETCAPRQEEQKLAQCGGCGCEVPTIADPCGSCGYVNITEQECTTC